MSRAGIGSAAVRKPEFRFSRIGTMVLGDVELELRGAIEPWNTLGEQTTAAGAARYVDSSVERLQVRVVGADRDRFVVTCNGMPVPLLATDKADVQVAGVGYRAWQPPNSLHPTITVDAPLVFDLIDAQTGLSRGGCTYHVAHPGGMAYDEPPVNVVVAQSRRNRRFEAAGHTTFGSTRGNYVRKWQHSRPISVRRAFSICAGRARCGDWSAIGKAMSDMRPRRTGQRLAGEARSAR